MQTSDNGKLFFAEHTNVSRIRDYLLECGWVAQVRASDAGPATEYCHDDYVGKIGIIEPYATHFCDSCNRLRVSSQGKVHLCLFDKASYDVREFLASGDVTGLKRAVQNLMPIKPEHHHLHEQNSGLMNNLSMIGG